MALACSLTQRFTFEKLTKDFGEKKIQYVHFFEKCTFCFANFYSDLRNVPKRLRKTVRPTFSQGKQGQGDQ